MAEKKRTGAGIAGKYTGTVRSFINDDTAGMENNIVIYMIATAETDLNDMRKEYGYCQNDR